MTDNLTTIAAAAGGTLPVGTTLATDDESSVHYPKTKLIASASGSTEELTKATDSSFVTGQHGLAAIAVRKDTFAAIASADSRYGPLQLTPTGALRIAIAEDAVGSAVDNDDGTIQAAQPNIALTIGMPHVFDGTSWVRGGLTPHSIISAATTNATSVKAAAGILGMLFVSNINASPRYIKFYNKASAPTVGTDTPILRFIIPGNTAGAGFNVPLPAQGIAFSTGIAYAITTGELDNSTGAVAANEILVNLGYK